MIQADAAIPSIASAIQLSIAPVFLLTGVGAILGVLTNRLARIVDRSRARLMNRAIAMCTFGALLVCLVIVTIFVSTFADAHLGQVIALAFTGAMVALIGALVTFLREINLATRGLRTGPP